MLTKRVIACFDVIAGRVTKAQQFQDNIDVAAADELATRLYDDQIDEIVFYDITASSERRKIDLDTVRAVARRVFVPFTVGGGIRSIDDMFEVLKAGAEKISVDSMAVRDPDIIRQGAEAFGRQCIVLSTQVKDVGIRPGIPSGYEVFVDGARTATGMDAIEWVQRGESSGAGEICVNSIDRDGTASGYDLDITRAVADSVNVPVIASGGAGTVEHIADGLTAGGASAAIISSILYSPRFERNLGVQEIKVGLTARGIPTRPVPRRLIALRGRRPRPRRGAPLQSTGRVGPEALEVVVLAGLAEEDVHDEVAVVEQHPGGVGHALDAAGRVARLVLDPALDLVDDRPHLAGVRSARDHEVLGDRDDLADLEDDGIHPLLVVGRPGGGDGSVLRVRGMLLGSCRRQWWLAGAGVGPASRRQTSGQSAPMMTVTSTTSIGLSARRRLPHPSASSSCWAAARSRSR